MENPQENKSESLYDLKESIIEEEANKEVVDPNQLDLSILSYYDR